MDHGTLSENKVPDPQYALPSTVNWMRAITIICEAEQINYTHATKLFSKVTKSKMSPPQQNSIFEHLLLAIHQLAALYTLRHVNVQSDIVRISSVAWYYGIYAAAQSMIVAQESVIQDNHSKTANAWDRQFAQRELVLHPFDLRVSTLVKNDAQAEIDLFRRGPKTNLVSKPESIEEAHQAICSYLSGTVGWMSWTIEEKLKESPEFKKLGVTNFRTKSARELRDKRLRSQSASFLHQAYRFRGKANYREALYLAHGTHVEKTISGFVSDMADVLQAFLVMAGTFAFSRLGHDLTEEFLLDLDQHRSFSLDHRMIWS